MTEVVQSRRFEGGLYESYAARGKYNIARGPVDGVLDYDQIADCAGRKRFREAESTGADVFMTSCPACLMQFQQTRSRLRGNAVHPLQVMDITEIIWNQLVLPGES